MGKKYHSGEEHSDQATQSWGFGALLLQPRKVTEFKANFSGGGHGCPAPLEPSNAALCYNETMLSLLKRKIGQFLTRREMDFHLKVFPPCKQVRLFQVISLF